jgi:hypothetical protein
LGGDFSGCEPVQNDFASVFNGWGALQNGFAAMFYACTAM